MGFDVKVTPGAAVNIEAAVRRGLLEVGEEVRLASEVLAPREPEPRHGVHMIDTTFVLVEPGVEEDTVFIGYRAFWAVWQHEDLGYAHPNGGSAKFLEIPLMAAGDAVLERVGEQVRRALML